MAKKWIICGNCQHFNECIAGKAKMQNVYIDSPIYNEIGCFSHEQYKRQTEPVQKKLF